MRKRILIDKVESILKKEGFDNNDYIISMQGPTVIFSQKGNSKLNTDLKNKLTNLITIL